MVGTFFTAIGAAYRSALELVGRLRQTGGPAIKSAYASAAYKAGYAAAERGLPRSGMPPQVGAYQDDWLVGYRDSEEHGLSLW